MGSEVLILFKGVQYVIIKIYFDADIFPSLDWRSLFCVCVFLTLWLKYYWLLQKEDAVNIHAQVFFWTHTCIFSWADTWEWSGRIIQSVWAQHFRTCQLPQFPLSASGCFSSCAAPSGRGKVGLQPSQHMSNGISLWLFTGVSWMAMRLNKVSCA